MLVVYVGTHDEVEINGGPIAAYGEPVEVSDELAGQAPTGERWTEDYEPGSGLLAQVDNWATPDSDAAKAAAETKAAAQAPDQADLDAAAAKAKADADAAAAKAKADADAAAKAKADADAANKGDNN